MRSKNLPPDEDQDIIEDKVITLNGKKVMDTGIDEIQLRLVHIYKEDENK